MASVQAIVFSADGARLPDNVQSWLNSIRIPVWRTADADEVLAIALRSRPRFVLVDARDRDADEALRVVRRLKVDSFSAVIPALVIAGADGALLVDALEAGGDEVVMSTWPAADVAARLDAAVRRSDRDLQVHPSTRMPGAVGIEAEITRRLAGGAAFAACYADLDYFKEFNDRYSYRQGDRVIRIVSQILHDVVRGLCGGEGFVGHIGGDDFLFIIPVEPVGGVCSEVISVFDALIPLQYSDQDRRAGYFFGKDRRGQLHRVPLMTVSIGVVTNERRHFTHPAQVSTLATEMKSYAKTLAGSVYTIDRRQDEPPTGGRRSEPIRLITPPTRDGGIQ